MRPTVVARIFLEAIAQKKRYWKTATLRAEEDRFAVRQSNEIAKGNVMNCPENGSVNAEKNVSHTQVASIASS